MGKIRYYLLSGAEVFLKTHLYFVISAAVLRAIPLRSAGSITTVNLIKKRPLLRVDHLANLRDRLVV